jgi:GTP cyclohydrolase IA
MSATYEDAIRAVRVLLDYIGEDVDREGLRETPSRVVNAWGEWACGYNQDPTAVLKTFEDGATDEMVIVHDIPVISKCEHHLSDVIGIAHVGYIPDGRIVGLSKLARLVDIFARRLQTQERMGSQIADALMVGVNPLGVGVLIRANHHCMSTRGVRIHGSQTTTSAMRGVMLTKPEARSEFLRLVEMSCG